MRTLRGAHLVSNAIIEMSKKSITRGGPRFDSPLAHFFLFSPHPFLTHNTTPPFSRPQKSTRTSHHGISNPNLTDAAVPEEMPTCSRFSRSNDSDYSQTCRPSQGQILDPVGAWVRVQDYLTGQSWSKSRDVGGKFLSNSTRLDLGCPTTVV